MLPINYLYWIFKPLLQLTWRTAYSIKIIGKENIDFKKPTLIIANHTNAVIDPIAIAQSVSRGIFFLARGDAFANNFLKWLLWQYHIIPIYRKEECDDNLEKNKETFGRMFELFDKARPVIIFSEGKCIQEKTIREFRKGTAHILVDYANEKQDLNKLHIQPIGLNYQYYNKFRADLIINFGNPFTLQDLSLDDINSKESIQIITQKTQESLAKCMVIQTEPDLYGMEISSEEIIGNKLSSLYKNKNSVQTLFDARAHITQKLAYQYNTQKEHFLAFKKELSQLENTLQNYKIPLSVLNRNHTKWILYATFLLLTFPLFIAGFLLNAIPFFVPKIIVKKKVKNPVFESTVRVVLGMFLFLIFYLGYFFFIPMFFELETFLQKMSVGFGVVLFAYFSLLFSYEWFQKCKEVKGFFTFSWLKKEEQNVLIALHQSCKNWLMKNIVLK
jgi:1-acyl-sn-glycerol-3-phosphate acyltransferase